jgi:hypothetical protein
MAVRSPSSLGLGSPSRKRAALFPPCLSLPRSSAITQNMAHQSNALNRLRCRLQPQRRKEQDAEAGLPAIHNWNWPCSLFYLLFHVFRTSDKSGQAGDMGHVSWKAEDNTLPSREVRRYRKIRGWGPYGDTRCGVRPRVFPFPHSHLVNCLYPLY